MPLPLTDHVDRSKEKQLLRGRIGFVHAICFHEGQIFQEDQGSVICNKLPVSILVRFEGVSWTVGSLPPGVYPIKVRRNSWYLDKGRQYPCLRVSRRQFPLAPAFAIIAHAAQGQTLEAAIVDLQISKGTSPLASYVALTRVRSRAGRLIYLRFAKSLFKTGCVQGPSLLLRHLRGEKLDWAAIEAEHMPTKTCTGCGFVVYKDKFARSQWCRKDGRHYCVDCVRARVHGGTPFECKQCYVWKCVSAFDAEYAAPQKLHKICIDCVEVRVCSRCGINKRLADFTARQWARAMRPLDARHVRRGRQEGACIACFRKRDMKPCRVCSQQLGEESFVSRMWMQSDDQRVCVRCSGALPCTVPSVVIYICLIMQDGRWVAWCVTGVRGHETAEAI